MTAPIITALDVRVANPPLAVPHATSGGVVGSYPMVLLDLRTSAGITGCAYVFTYTLMAAPAVAREPVLKRPVAVREGLVWPGLEPGIGIEWDEAALAPHLVKGA